LAKQIFQVRDYLNSYDDDDAWQEVEAFDAEDAANDYMDANFPYEDSGGPFEVEVKSPDGVISLWEVEVEFEPIFHASQMVSITINGKSRLVTERVVDYNRITWWAFPFSFGEGERPVFSVTYHKAAGPKPDGILSPGGYVTLQEGTVFNVAHTGTA
jgi:hypothetical protein